MIADYYNDYLSASTRFRLKLLEDKKQATSGADLLARVQILRSVLRTLDYDNSLPIDAKLGKPDLVVTYEDGSTCAIELVLATRKMEEQKEHADRFLSLALTDSSAANQQVLVIIEREKIRVKCYVQAVQAHVEGKVNGPEVIGLAVSASHEAYDMYMANEEEPVYFACDSIAKALKTDGRLGHLESAQDCVTIPPVEDC